MSRLLDQMRYKASWYDTQIVEADQWYPSSKACSSYGVINGDLGREPEWVCPNCDAPHDRNRNAARNRLKLALLAVGENVTLLDGEALAGGDPSTAETAPIEGRTRPTTTALRQLQVGSVTIVDHSEYPTVNFRSTRAGNKFPDQMPQPAGSRFPSHWAARSRWPG